MVVQELPSRKGLVSFKFRVLTKDERKMSTLYREFCGIISALHTYEHFIIGSTHPIKVFCDHEPLWCLCGHEKEGVLPILLIPDDFY